MVEMKTRGGVGVGVVWCGVEWGGGARLGWDGLWWAGGVGRHLPRGAVHEQCNVPIAEELDEPSAHEPTGHGHREADSQAQKLVAGLLANGMK